MACSISFPTKPSDLKSECGSANGLDLLSCSPSGSSEAPDLFFPSLVCTYKEEEFDCFYEDLTSAHPPIFLVTLAEDPTLCDPNTVDCKSEESAHTDKPSVGPLSRDARRVKIQRYREKKARRNFAKKIAYQCRKTVADNRVRVKGRFITKVLAEKLKTSAD